MPSRFDLVDLNRFISSLLNTRQKHQNNVLDVTEYDVVCFNHVDFMIVKLAPEMSKEHIQFSEVRSCPMFSLQVTSHTVIIDCKEHATSCICHHSFNHKCHCNQV